MKYNIANFELMCDCTGENTGIKQFVHNPVLREVIGNGFNFQNSNFSVQKKHLGSILRCRRKIPRSTQQRFLFCRSEMLPRNLHFKTSAPDDSNAGGLSPTLRNPGHKTHRYHRNGEKQLLQEMVKTVQRKAILLVKNNFLFQLFRKPPEDTC